MPRKRGILCTYYVRLQTGESTPMTIGTRDTTRLDDLYTAVLIRIESDDLDGALDLYHSVSSDVDKLDLLHRLQSTSSRIRFVDLDFALDLALARAHAHAYALTRALAHNLNLDLERIHARARACGRALARAVTLADQASIPELQEQIMVAVRLNRFMVAALGSYQKP